MSEPVGTNTKLTRSDVAAAERVAVAEARLAAAERALSFLQPVKLVGILAGLVTLIGGATSFVAQHFAKEHAAVAVGKLAERHAETATLVTRLQEQRRELVDRVRVLEWQIQRAAERVGPLGQAPIQVRRASPKTTAPRKKP